MARPSDLLQSLGGDPAEAPLALVEGANGAGKDLAVEIWPVLLDEHEFGIGKLPQQKIRQSLLAARSNQKVGIGYVGKVERRRQVLGSDRIGSKPAFGNLGRDQTGGAHDLLTAAIVEGDDEGEAGVAGS